MVTTSAVRIRTSTASRSMASPNAATPACRFGLIAGEAGVAPQTIYAISAPRAGVLAGLVEPMDEEAGLPDLVAGSESIEDPVELLGLPAMSGNAAATSWLRVPAAHLRRGRTAAARKGIVETSDDERGRS